MLFNIASKKSVKKKGKTFIGCSACKRMCKKDTIVYGEGKKGIVIVTPYNYVSNDRPSKEYLELKSTLLAKGIVINQDAYLTSISPCMGKDTPNRINMQDKHYLDCATTLITEIKKLKPKLIITIGARATKFTVCSRLSGRLDGTKGSDFFNYKIPDREFNAWIIPIFSSYEKSLCTQKRSNNVDPVFTMQYKRQINSIIEHIEKPLLIIKEPKIEYITRVEDACDWLSMQHDLWIDEKVSFDLETTGLKPQSKLQKIRCIAFRSDDVCGVMPYFVGSETFRYELKKIMTNPRIKKIAQKLQYEDAWIYEKGDKEKYRVEGWYWDTLLAEHCMNSKAKISLKFQAYVYEGILNYDGDIDKYLKTTDKSCNAINNVFDAPLDKLMMYCAYDTIYTQDSMHRQEEWFAMKEHKHLMEGLQLLIDGSLVLNTMHLNGQGFDTKLAIKQKVEIENEIKERIAKLKTKSYSKGWDGSLSGDNIFNHVYKTLGLKNVDNKKTPKGKDATDIDVLEKMNHPFTIELLAIKKLDKIVNTYIKSYLREEVNGRVYPYFSLDRTATFRSCLAKGTLIKGNFDTKLFPDGKPIEDVAYGDYVYCFNNKLEPQLKKVLWGEKTGHREVIRLHFNKGRGKKGYVDLTPEHRVRTINGTYVEARYLLNDFRTEKQSRRSPKSRVLSMEKANDRLFFTGKKDILEHRFIYEQMNNIKLDKANVIHHIDGNHYNNCIDNLQKLNSNADHARIHVNDTINKPSSRLKNIEVVRAKHKNGGYIYKKGIDNPLYKFLTKKQCLDALHKAKGIITKVPYDFECFKSKCDLHNINVGEIKKQYNADGVFLDLDTVYNTLKKFGFDKTKKVLKIGNARLIKLCDAYNITYERSYKNQNGYNKKHQVYINNHVITSIEYINKVVDVYDIEVEDCHNFIANGLCVHNSSQAPNAQNAPKRNKKIKKIIRKCILPRKGRRIMAWDYKALETIIAGCNYHDKNWIAYQMDLSADMHWDWTVMMFDLDDDFIDDLILDKIKDVVRSWIKNQAIFPSIYGSSPYNVANNVWTKMKSIPLMWDWFEEKGWDDAPILDERGEKQYDKKTKELITNKINFMKHIEKKYDYFWNEWFPEYRDIRQKDWEVYRKQGYIDNLTGFRYQGILGYTEFCNYKIQGSASHIKLWTAIMTEREIKKRGLKTKLFGEIHDEILADVPENETYIMDEIVQNIGTKLVREHWPWIIIPLVINCEASPVDGTWEDMKPLEEYEIK